MSGWHFISYAPDDKALAQHLQKALENSEFGYTIRLTKPEHRAINFLDQDTEEAINLCQIFMLIATSTSVDAQSSCQQEWQTALSYKKQVIVLKFQADVKMPAALKARDTIDFTDFSAGMSEFQSRLAGLHTPAGRLQKLKADRHDARRRRQQAVDDQQRQRIDQEIFELDRQITALERTLAQPEDVYAQTNQRIKASLKLTQQAQPPPKRVTTKFINNPALETKPHFQARQLETRRIGDWLKNPFVRIITVVGAGGVGKTAMVYRILGSLQKYGKMPDDGVRLDVDGIVYLSGIGTRQITVFNLYHDLLKLLAPQQEEELTALYKNAILSTSDKFKALFDYFLSGRVLVVLDNFEDVMDTATGHILDRDLAEALKTIARYPHAIQVLLTTRLFPQDLATIRPENQARFTLDHLVEQDTLTFLRNNDPANLYGLQNASQNLLERAFAITQGYPRALEALVAILKVDSRIQLEDILHKAEWYKRENSNPDNQANNVHFLVQEAFKHLPELARQVMQVLAVFQRPVSAGAVDYVLQPLYLDIDSAPILAWLVEADFVYREAGRYYLHPIDRSYAHTLLPTESSDFAYSHLALARRAASYYRQIQKPATQWHKFDDLENHIAEYQMHLQAEAFEAAAHVLTTICFDYLLLWGYSREVVQYYEPLYAKIVYSREITPARSNMHSKILSNYSRLNALFNLGHAHDILSNFTEALTICQTGLAVARELNDKPWTGVFMSMIGSIFRSLGEIEQAIDYYEQALENARERGDRKSEGVRLGNLGNAYSHLGKLDQAIEYYEQALAIAEAFDDKTNQGVWLGNLGNRYMDLGREEQAIAYYEQALNIAEALGDIYNIGVQTGNLGRIYHDNDQFDQAIEYYERALQITHQIGDRRNESVWLGNLGNIQRELGHLHQAIDYHQQAYAIDAETGYRRGETAQVRNLGRDHAKLGQAKQAIEYFKQALAISREIKYKDGERLCLNELGNVYAGLGQLKESITYYKQALVIAREIGNRSAQSTYLSNLGARYYEIGDLASALEYHEEALIIDQTVGDQHGEVYSLDSLGQDHLLEDRFELALDYLHRAVALADKLDYTQAQGHTRWSLACAYLLQHELAQARSIIDVALSKDKVDDVGKVYVLQGVIALCQNEKATAEVSLRAGIAQLQETLKDNERQHIVWDELGLAYCGLALATDDSACVIEARAAYQKARAIMDGIGHITETLRLLEALSRADTKGLIGEGVFQAAQQSNKTATNHRPVAED